MFIVEDIIELIDDICDQRFIEFEIHRQNPDAFVIRKSLAEVCIVNLPVRCSFGLLQQYPVQLI